MQKTQPCLKSGNPMARKNCDELGVAFLTLHYPKRNPHTKMPYPQNFTSKGITFFHTRNTKKTIINHHHLLKHRETKTKDCPETHTKNPGYSITKNSRWPPIHITKPKTQNPDNPGREEREERDGAPVTTHTIIISPSPASEELTPSALQSRFHFFAFLSHRIADPKQSTQHAQTALLCFLRCSCSVG